MIAYGSRSVVVVLEPRTVQPLQTLAHHKSNVIKVCMYVYCTDIHVHVLHTYIIIATWVL